MGSNSVAIHVYVMIKTYNNEIILFFFLGHQAAGSLFWLRKLRWKPRLHDTFGDIKKLDCMILLMISAEI